MPPSDIGMDEAQTIALKALEFILADTDLQTDFLAATGMSPRDIHASIQKTDFLGGVLDFLLTQEEALIKFCEKYNIDPTVPSPALKALSMTPGETKP